VVGRIFKTCTWSLPHMKAYPWKTNALKTLVRSKGLPATLQIPISYTYHRWRRLMAVSWCREHLAACVAFLPKSTWPTHCLTSGAYCTGTLCNQKHAVCFKKQALVSTLSACRQSSPYSQGITTISSLAWSLNDVKLPADKTHYESHQQRLLARMSGPIGRQQHWLFG